MFTFLKICIFVFYDANNGKFIIRVATENFNAVFLNTLNATPVTTIEFVLL